MADDDLADFECTAFSHAGKTRTVYRKGSGPAVIVLAEMPGVSTEGVDISLERRVLTIRGHSAANEHAGYQRVYNEYAGGDYERVFTLYENIGRDRIEATLMDGVLQLVLPKAEAANARKIELKAY